MDNKWSAYPLSELVEDFIDRRGVTPTKLGSDFTSAGHRVISAKLIKGSRIDLSADEPRFVNATTYRKWMASPLHEDDVIMTSEAPLGELAWVSQKLEWCLGQRLFGIRTDKQKLNGRFLFYALQSEAVRNDLISRATGTTVTGIRQSELRKVAIPLPPLAEQKRVAGILGTLDDKIELNRKTNETLEQMARAMFKSWFVDFDPVHAKAAGRQPTGMDKATADLFPDSFMDSELGKIPKGWEVCNIGSALDILETGRRPKGGVSSYTSGVPSIGAESINGIGVFDYSKTKYIPQDYYETISSGRVTQFDVLLYKDGGKPGEFKPRVGMFAYNFPFPVFCINEHVFRMRSYKLGQYFLYFLISDKRVLTDFANKGGKAAIPGINQPDVKSTIFINPSAATIAAFNRSASQLCNQIIRNAIENKTLADLRDVLLPRLLGGDVSMAKGA